MTPLDADEDEVGSHIKIDPGDEVRPHEKRHQILALSGGGYRGLYSATFLAHTEEEFHCPCRERFGLIAGTSIGGLIAAALSLGIEARKIATKIAEHGPKIFPHSIWTPLKQLFVAAPYSAENLKNAVLDTFGEELANLPLKEVDAPLVLCAMNYTHGCPAIFCSRGVSVVGASQVTVLEAVLASAAAPTYFPPQMHGPDAIIDGGLIANAPDLVAVAEARKGFGWDIQNIYILSVGTASRRQGAALTPLGKPSTVSWMVRRQLFQSTMAAQEELTANQCKNILGPRFHRVDREPDQTQTRAISRLDKADKEATATIISLAAASWQHEKTQLEFRDFFA